MNENIQLICPKTHKALSLSDDQRFYQTKDGSQKYPIDDGIVRFLEKNDDFYEGAYTATVNWMPSSERWFHVWPIILLHSGFVNAVRKEVNAGATILEVGCGGGIKYFQKRYNVIGLDLSFESLKGSPYAVKLQGDATNAPLPSNSVDAIVSCSFWEHIPVESKIDMLKEFKRILKKNGKLIFFYDVETNNKSILKLKRVNPILYNNIFIEKDGHLGYHTPDENREIFENSDFFVKKHFGKERTGILGLSAISKLSKLESGWNSKIIIYNLFKNGILLHVYNLLLWVIDNSIGRIYNINRSRVILTVAVRK